MYPCPHCQYTLYGRRCSVAKTVLLPDIRCLNRCLNMRSVWMQEIAEYACLTIPHTLRLIVHRDSPQKPPHRLGLPSANQATLHNLFLSVLVRACERTSSWDSFRANGLVLWVLRWRECVSAAVDHFYNQGFRSEGSIIGNPLVELLPGTTNYVKMMSKYLLPTLIPSCMHAFKGSTLIHRLFIMKGLDTCSAGHRCCIDMQLLCVRFWTLPMLISCLTCYTGTPK